ncbi:KRAB-A domain-containing protein 2-like [Solenopsis invicta]|uniref:KRAB-A domain-containing protein 2-like n=1 Tax=Solenopsis invicta TaxID=13686 RepID=UPI00193E7C32|nr:KRAB-A domain-containing protein 2-like [Solenopsis invicta]
MCDTNSDTNTDTNSTTNTAADKMREKFNEKLKSLKLSINSFLIENSDAYENLICAVEEAKIRNKKTYTDYRRLKRYDVLSVGESKKLIQPVLEHEKKIKYYVHNEQVFDIIHMAHLETGHGGKHKLENNIKTKYVNITREVIHIYLELCLICKKKKTHLKKGVVVKPLIFKEINHRAQVDLIDMQTSKDGEYKFILNYQEHLTKFVCLRPLKTKTAVEVAYNLVDIFCIIGCPSVLQSDNGREFCNSVIEELKSMWPDLENSAR